MTYHVVWFKRDLRLHDHAALRAASQPALAGNEPAPVLCLYIIEPSLWAQPDAAAHHYAFISESLEALHLELKKAGGQLQIAVGEAVDVLARLHQCAPFKAVFAHEETGNAHTFQRDLAVGQWCKHNGVGWHEFAQFGVKRRLSGRNHWQRHRDEFMATPQIPTPQLRFAHTESFRFGAEPFRKTLEASRPQLSLPSPTSLSLDPYLPPQRQRGGRARGLSVLNHFLDERSAGYRGGISSPLSATSACSRLSAHLAYGTLSLREVVQATRNRIQTLPLSAQRQRKGLEAFSSRLAWHCHFIQKLESEPAIEYRNMHRGYDGLREAEWNPAHFDALTQGRTGWPMVDACVAMLRATGWLNFRMRAMLVSVAAYPLWLHWREVGLWLARQFLDYEPGIHWSQMQMQSGTTGINTTRVYNPVKQALDHDPEGRFVRRWLPAMRRVPDAWLFEPWRMPQTVQAQCDVRVGTDIPIPVTDLELATRLAKSRVHALRQRADVREAKGNIVERHASRKSGTARASIATRQNTPQQHAAHTTDVGNRQLVLDF